MELSGLTIKTKADLDQLLKFLDREGFGYMSSWDFHNKKVNHIISNANKLDVKYENKFKEKLQSLTDYEEMEKLSNEYFSKFSNKDKIFELFNNFYLQEDDLGKVPSMSPDTNDVINWYKFRKKYNLLDDFKSWTNIYVYNFDKSFIKFRFSDYSSYEFKRLYKLILGEECGDFDAKRAGIWQDVGKLEIKLFSNNNANIKGAGLKEFKENYYQYIKNQKNASYIIIYNKKREMNIRED